MAAQVNAMIPLSVNQVQMPDQYRQAQAMVSIAQAQQQMREFERAEMTRAQIQNVFADPAMSDGKGGLKPEAINRIMGVDPATGIKIDRAMLDRTAANADLTIKGQSLIEDKVRAPSAIAYREARKEGLSEEQANARAQDVYTAGLKEVTQSGLFSEKQIAEMPQNFDFARVSARSKQYQDWSETQRKGVLEERKQGETERHNRRAEDVQFGNLDVSRGNLAERRRETDERAQERKDRLAREAKPDYSKPVELEVKGPDGKRSQVLGQQDENKNSPTYGKWVTADDKRAPIEGSDFRVIKGNQTAHAEESVDVMADAIANYRTKPLTGMALRTPHGEAIMAEVMRKNPNYNATEYEGRAKAVRDFSTGKQGQSINSFNVAVSHLETLADLGRAMKNGDTKVINRVRNAFEEQFGGTAPSNFNAAKGIVGDELVKAILGAGAGALADREEMKKNLDRAKSWDQLEGVIKTYTELMGGQLKGLKKQYEQTTGLKNFDERLSDETKAALGWGGAKKGGGEAKAEPAAAGGGGGGVSLPTSKADFDALPAGTRYRKPGDPEGSYRVKGG